MMLSYITFTNSFTSDILTTAGTIVSDLEPFLTLILGVLIAVFVVAVLVKVFVK